VYALPYAPFSVVYPSCAVVIHHGGISTAAQALRAGVPQLVVPWVLDQFWTAAQVERIGAGVAAGIAGEDSAATLCDAIGEIVDSRNKVVDNQRK
jgi:rhamnosyltransferase subunit B